MPSSREHETFLAEVLRKSRFSFPERWFVEEYSYTDERGQVRYSETRNTVPLEHQPFGGSNCFIKVRILPEHGLSGAVLNLDIPLMIKAFSNIRKGQCTGMHEDDRRALEMAWRYKTHVAVSYFHAFQAVQVGLWKEVLV